MNIIVYTGPITVLIEGMKSKYYAFI